MAGCQWEMGVVSGPSLETPHHIQANTVLESRDATEHTSSGKVKLFRNPSAGGGGGGAR